MSNFDDFLVSEQDLPRGDTTYKVCPPGEFRAMIDDFDNSAFRAFENKDGRQFTVFSPPFVILDPAVQAEVGREKVVVFHKGIFLDLTPEGKLDFSSGRNVQLNKLREAVGQNVPGKWSFAKLRGAGPVLVRVIHEENRDDPEQKYARVVKVTKA